MQEGKVHKRMEKEELMTFSDVHLQVLASVTSHVAAACAWGNQASGPSTRFHVALIRYSMV